MNSPKLTSVCMNLFEWEDSRCFISYLFDSKPVVNSSDYFVLLLCILVSENVEMLLKLGPRLLAVTERGMVRFTIVAILISKAFVIMMLLFKPKEGEGFCTDTVFAFYFSFFRG